MIVKSGPLYGVEESEISGFGIQLGYDAEWNAAFIGILFLDYSIIIGWCFGREF